MHSTGLFIYSPASVGCRGRAVAARCGRGVSARASAGVAAPVSAAGAASVAASVAACRAGVALVERFDIKPFSGFSAK